jgi:GNAT superfamily N-acetyltransferase
VTIDAAVAAHMSWMRDVADATGGRVWHEDGLLVVHQPRPHAELLLPFPDAIDGRALARVVDWARDNEVRIAGCWGRDEHAPAPPGFEPGWEPHWMAAGAVVTAADPRVSMTADVPEYDDHGQALLRMTEGRSRHFVARDEDGRFAGMAWLHLPDETPSAAGLFDFLVPPHVRRRGFGTALVRAACSEAARLGRDQVVLNATHGGELLYRSAGFRSLGRGRTWWLHLAP